MKSLKMLYWVGILLVSGCTTDPFGQYTPSGIRAEDYNPGVLTRQGLAFSRIISSPVMIPHIMAHGWHTTKDRDVVTRSFTFLANGPLLGPFYMSEEIVFGVMEMITFQQFKSSFYPWETFDVLCVTMNLDEITREHEEYRKAHPNEPSFLEQLAKDMLLAAVNGAVEGVTQGLADGLTEAAARKICKELKVEYDPTYLENSRKQRRNQTSVMTNNRVVSYGVPQSESINMDRYFQLMNLCEAAIVSENWDAAVRISRELAGKHSVVYVALSDATCRLTLSMLEWNVGNHDNAIQRMNEVISILDNGEYLGNGCSKAAVKLREKMLSGTLGNFRNYDFLNPCGVQSYVMADCKRQFNLSIEASNRHHDILQRRMDNEIQRYQKRGDDFEWMEKFNANQEYLKKTYDTFDPSNRPPEGSSKREAWDACKRVHDIFD